MARVNLLKKVKIEGIWKLLSIPRNTRGNYDWTALPDGEGSTNSKAGNWGSQGTIRTQSPLQPSQSPPQWRSTSNTLRL